MLLQLVWVSISLPIHNKIKCNLKWCSNNSYILNLSNLVYEKYLYNYELTINLGWRNNVKNPSYLCPIFYIVQLFRANI